jgi:hypothetical protein
MRATCFSNLFSEVHAIVRREVVPNTIGITVQFLSTSRVCLHLINAPEVS